MSPTIIQIVQNFENSYITTIIIIIIIEIIKAVERAIFEYLFVIIRQK